MTKTKLMLVAGTLILAAAGATSAKVNYRAQTVWYSTGAGAQTVEIQQACAPGATGCTTTIGSSLHVQLYRTTDAGQLSDPLRAE